MTRILLSLLAVVLFASACGGGSTASSELTTTLPEEAEDSAEEERSSASVDVDVVDSAADDEPDHFIEAGGDGIDLHPVEDEALWRCGDELTLSLEQLAGFDSLPNAAADTFAVASQFDSLGESSSWARLDDRWIVDRRLLDSQPPALFLADAQYGGAVGCTPTRSTRMRPVAWEQVGPTVDGSATIAFEGCVDPGDLVVDRRTLGEDTLVGLFTSVSPDAGSCLVDGSATSVVEVDGNGSLLSSQFWPFVPGDPAVFPTIGPHPQVAPVTTSQVDAIRCEVSASATDLYVEFAGLPPGVTASFFVDGAPWLDHEPTRTAFAAAIDRAVAERYVEYGNEPWEWSEFDGGYSFFGANAGQTYRVDLRLGLPNEDELIVSCGAVTVESELPVGKCSVREVAGAPWITVDDGMLGAGRVTIFRDGAPLDLGLQLGGPLDVTAEPGVEYMYEAEIADPIGQRESVRVPCGTFALEPPRDGLEYLTDAKDRFALLGGGAHFYLTLVAPDGREIEAAMSFGGDGFTFVSPELAPMSADPHTIHDRLIDAVLAGSDVEFEIDPWAGVVTSWSIDGEAGFETICLTSDTAPPELRAGPCDPSRDLIGRRSL